MAAVQRQFRPDPAGERHAAAAWHIFCWLIGRGDTVAARRYLAHKILDNNPDLSLTDIAVLLDVAETETAA